MRKTKLLLTALLTALLSLALGSWIPQALAQSYNVRTLIVGDEEYRDHATSVFGHLSSWQTLASFQMLLSQIMFNTKYALGIYLFLGTYVEWHSDWGPNDVSLMTEAIQETGFESGVNYDIMVIFTGEDLSTAAGFPLAGAAWREEAVAIIKDSFGYVLSGWDAYVANVIVHEISHLYDVLGHLPSQPEYSYCVMSEGDAGLTSEQWCSSCLNTIMSNREKYGYASGGGRGRFYPLSGVGDS